MRTRQFSIADLGCVLVCGLVALSIALVGVQRQRAAARGVTCVNNLKQLGLALHNYHSAYKQMPMGSGGSSAAAGAELWQNNQDRLSAWVGLTPFAEQQALWEEISNPKRVGAITFPSMGPRPGTTRMSTRLGTNGLACSFVRTTKTRPSSRPYPATR